MYGCGPSKSKGFHNASTIRMMILFMFFISICMYMSCLDVYTILYQGCTKNVNHKTHCFMIHIVGSNDAVGLLCDLSLFSLDLI